MKPTHLLLVVMAVLMVIVLPACTLPASTPPAAITPTVGNFPVPGTETMDIFESIATQTAMAGGGIIQPTQPEAQPTAAPTEPPAPAVPTPVPPTPAPTRPPVVVPTATPGLPSTYTLQKGEYVYCIARRFDLNPVDLLAANGLGVNSIIPEGTTIVIPQTGNGFPAERELISHPDTYTVQAGDTIYSIACDYGDADPNAIAVANGLEEPYAIAPGETLDIP